MYKFNTLSGISQTTYWNAFSLTGIFPQIWQKFVLVWSRSTPSATTLVSCWYALKWSDAITTKGNVIVLIGTLCVTVQNFPMLAAMDVIHVRILYGPIPTISIVARNRDGVNGILPSTWCEVNVLSWVLPKAQAYFIFLSWRRRDILYVSHNFLCF